ncbi:hypothetical protein K2X05_02600 [bacterium]|nr:hypothetical protein [bacterium]
MKLKTIKYTIFFCIIIQILFSIFFEFLTDSINLYPLYTWRIFHTQPDKKITNYEIYIHQIDNVIFNPPKRGAAFVEEIFPKIKTYTFVKKLRDYDADVPRRSRLINELEHLFTEDQIHNLVIWEISKQQFNPIDFYWKHRLIDEKFLGKNVSKRENQ